MVAARPGECPAARAFLRTVRVLRRGFRAVEVVGVGRGGISPRVRTGAVGRCRRVRWGRSIRGFRRGVVGLSNGELLLGVVSLAEVREVAHVGGSAEGVVEGVVDFAADGGGGAAGPPAVAVAGPEVPVDRGGAVVGVGSKHLTGDGVGDDPVPRDGCGLGQRPGRLGVDGSVADEVGGVEVLVPGRSIVNAGTTTCTRARIAPSTPGPSSPRWGRHRRSGQQQVGENIGAHLIADRVSGEGMVGSSRPSPRAPPPPPSPPAFSPAGASRRAASRRMSTIAALCCTRRS